MGSRGANAVSAKDREDLAKLARKRLPWRKRGLSRAQRVIAFIEHLPITSGLLCGQKMRLMDWQKEWIEAVYRTNGDGARIVRTALLSVGRKNGKSGLAAGLTLCHLLGPESEPRGQCYTAACDRAQAAIIFSEMSAIIDLCPEFAHRVKVSSYHKRIEVLDGDGAGSRYEALSSDAKTKMGLSPSFSVVDEFGFAPNDELLTALQTASGARSEPLMVVISTQAPNDQHPFSQMIDYALKIERGEETNDAFYGKLYAAETDDDPWHPETWAKANPAIGVFRSLEDIARQSQEAQKMPGKEAAFRNLILNQRIAAETRFVNASEWKACCGELRPDLDGKVAYGGLDLSWSRDLTALVLVVPDADGTYDVVTRAWLPDDGLHEKAREDRTPWTLWRDQGHLTTCRGKTISPRDVALTILDYERQFDLRAIGYDRWGIANLKRELDAVGSKVELVPIGQGFRDMAPACDKLESAIARTELRTGGNPILTMSASNAVVSADPAGNRKLTKSKSDGKIDPLVALAMALTAASDHTPATMPACLAALV